MYNVVLGVLLRILFMSRDIFYLGLLSYVP